MVSSFSRALMVLEEAIGCPSNKIFKQLYPPSDLHCLIITDILTEISNEKPSLKINLTGVHFCRGGKHQSTNV